MYRLRHQAFLYDSPAQLVDGVAAFVEDGLEQGEPAMIALPEPALSRVHSRLGSGDRALRLYDMHELGRNPARIISAIADFIECHPGRRTRMVGEPVWPGRAGREATEAARHDALINLAFAGAGITILCPYALSLETDILSCAHVTHPELLRNGSRSASETYAYERVAALDTDPLPAPPDGAVSMAAAADLGALRRWLRPHLDAAGLDAARRDDLTVAVNEAAGNALRHGSGPAGISVWDEEDRVICDIADGGRIDDPLAGRRRPPAESVSGRGLWLANQLCDLTQLRSGSGGTVLRLHMMLAG
jgi:anti-sigma regulatory factor (Ser/Thr protein kinase)